MRFPSSGWVLVRVTTLSPREQGEPPRERGEAEVTGASIFLEVACRKTGDFPQKSPRERCQIEKWASRRLT
jgi:hypothetical protein